MDDSGSSKGFGFIRFSNETEQQTALTSMMGVGGLGGKPLKVRDCAHIRGHMDHGISKAVARATAYILLRRWLEPQPTF